MSCRALVLSSLVVVVGCSSEDPSYSSEASALLDDVVPLGGRSSIDPRAGSDDYRMGDEFGKKPVTTASLSGASAEFRRAARATARVGGATGFYLGKFAGAHVMATNHHVYSTMSCAGRRVTLPLVDNLSFSCARMLGTWPSIDLALFEVTVAAAAEPKLAEVAGNFAFDDPIEGGAPLITVGFGVAANPGRSMMGNQDSDCRVMSRTGDLRLMADPDELNPGPYKAWSFAHACDSSHGDSGSAIVSRTTGLPIGILWTGRIPKAANMKSSAFLAEALASDHPDIWTQMNYAVPASKIREHIATVVADTTTAAPVRDILAAVIAPP